MGGITVNGFHSFQLRVELLIARGALRWNRFGSEWDRIAIARWRESSRWCAQRETRALHQSESCARDSTRRSASVAPRPPPPPPRALLRAVLLRAAPRRVNTVSVTAFGYASAAAASARVSTESVSAGNAVVHWRAASRVLSIPTERRL